MSAAGPPFALALAVALWAVAPPCPGSAAGDGEFLFETGIRPVLATRCVGCHGAERAEGGVRLDSRTGIAAAAAGGGLEKTIRGHGTAPAACVPDARVAETFLRWIARGWPWPENVTVTSAADREEAARRHWAFQPVREPEVPAGSPHPIDAFVRERLAREGLAFSPEADPWTLRRRLSVALTGLPPAVPETDEYTVCLDRLLASPRYGEHWARHWLDLARYSDTKGYVYAREEKRWPHAWAYRDWVVTALNRDLPYDRFVRLQLAADLCADRAPGDEAAMGFLTLGRRFLGVKHDVIDDRIDVVSRGMLGITVSCARCHDHKYDPVSTADYYALHGVFDSCFERLVTFGEGGDEAFWKAHEERLRASRETLATLRAEASGRVRERLADYLKAQTELHKYPADGFDQIFQKSDLLPAFVHAWRDFLRDADERRDPIFRHWHAYREARREDYVHVVVPGAHPRIEEVFRTVPRDFDEVIARYAAVLREPGEDPALRAVLHGPGSPCEVPEGGVANVETYFDTGSVNALWKLENAVHQGILDASPPVPAALILVDRVRPVESRVFRRGNPLTLGEKVPRRFPGFLSGPEAASFRTGSGRLELAQAIADPANPLTARVLVNRVWAHHFGTGLVATPSDFGIRAEPPSHPELLDWLAAWFVREGWSLKKLHRLILTSETWRQSSSGPADPTERAKARAVDPGNLLLWRMNPHRLGPEEFRDAMMAASGDLDLTPGGKPVEAFRPPYAKRRALYGRIDRQFVPAELRVFDFANPDLHIPKRNETTVPQQALYFLNHPFVLDRSRALAAVAGTSAGDDAERVRALFRNALRRDPSAAEIAECLAFVGEGAAPVSPEPSPTAADWTYGRGAYDEAAGRVTGLTVLPHFTGTAWQGGPQWPDPKLGWVQLTATGGHPGNDRNHAAVRRWTAPRAMTVGIRSKLIHEPEAGDGIRGFVVGSRAGLLGTAKVFAKSAELGVDAMAVEAGETIDFLVDIGDGLNSDQFLWEIRLGELAPGDGEKPVAVWDAKRDFPADTTTPLNGWEQLAQAILCSNEFLFVD
jgi:cytochrome c553